MTGPLLARDGDPADGLAVDGGIGCLAARVDDLRTAADLLHGCARDLRAAALAVGRVAADPGLAASAAVSPLTFAAAEHALLGAAGAPGGLVGAAVATEGLGTALGAAAAAYLTAERTADAVVRSVELAVGRRVGQVIAVGTLLALPPLLQAAAVHRAVDGLLPGGDPAPAPSSAGRTGGARSGGAGPAAAGVVAGLGDGAEHLVATVPGLLTGLLDPLPLVGRGWGAAAGTGWPPRTLPETSDLLLASAGAAGLLRERGPLTATTSGPQVGRPPRRVADLVGLVGAAYPDGGGRPGSVRVTRLDGPGGRRSWVVAVPGTQVWQPRTGANPLDVTSDVRSLAGRRNAAQDTVVAAMRAAGVRPGEPVCVVGHSLGGMVAAGIGADPAVRARFDVREIVTLGSPTGTYPVARDVGVLALEHEDDLVPRLDGAANPDRGRWVTVSRTVTPDGDRPDVVVTHDVSTYARTAALVDASHDPALVAARERLAPFLAAGTTATTVEVTGRRGAP